MNKLIISEINIYPVKSMGQISLQQSQVEGYGLHLDRRWMLVDSDGLMLTQRKLPRMGLIQPSFQQEQLILSADGQDDMIIPHIDSKQRSEVQVWNDHCQALDCGDPAALWLGQFLDIQCRLVYFPQNEQRQVDLDYAQPGDHTAFSDGFPFLLISQASLDGLNNRLETPIEMKRFRPNIVVRGCQPHAEDDWQGIVINGIEFRIVKPCSRCIIPNIEPATAIIQKEPANTLAGYRKKNHRIFFGQNMIAQQRGKITINDNVEILN
ncbi:MAG: MOSC domain-containing protein [Gammaproteobacteria bacterium]|nr:MOSC domain-containing protein [Gammaproteobacteria bacterium]